MKHVYLIFVIFSILLSLIYITVEETFFGDQAQKVALQNAVNKTNERKSVIQNFLKNTKRETLYIRSLDEFNKYLNDTSHRERLQNRFLSYIQSRPYITQLIFIDYDNHIKINIARDNKKSMPTLTTKKKFQEEPNNYYLHNKTRKKEKEAFYSTINLDFKNKKTNATLRTTIPIKHHNKFSGVLIVDYFMKDFLEKLTFTPLYDMIIFDNEGYTLYHYHHNKHWGFYKNPKINISDEFPQYYNEILSKPLLETELFISRKLNLPIEGGLNIILQLKQSYITKQKELNFNKYLYVLLITMGLSLILSFIIIKIFSKILLNLNEITKLNAEINSKNKKLEILFETASDGIHILDTKGNIVEANQSFAQSLGYTIDEIHQLNITQLDSSLSKNTVANTIQEIIKTPKIFETKYQKKDTKIIDVQINATGIELSGKKYLYASSRDITHHKKQELIMLEQSKMAAMGEMIGNIAHQWRQPLSAISTAASGLLLKYQFDKMDEKTMKQYVGGIVRNTQFLSDTIDTFRDFVKGEKVTKNIAIQKEILQAKGIISAILQNKFIELRDNIDYKNEITVNITTGELPQVLLNILNNAKDILISTQCTTDKKWIELNLLHLPNEKVIITIEDNGGGITEDILPHIFEPYFTTKHQSQGTGLGLHMSYKIITESIGGILYARNTKNGAKFFIEIPINKKLNS